MERIKHTSDWARLTKDRLISRGIEQRRCEKCGCIYAGYKIVCTKNSDKKTCGGKVSGIETVQLNEDVVLSSVSNIEKNDK